MSRKTLDEIFSENCLIESEKCTMKKCENFRPIVEKYLVEIDEKTGQKNEVTYLSYLLEYAFSKGKV